MNYQVITLQNALDFVSNERGMEALATILKEAIAFKGNFNIAVENNGNSKTSLNRGSILNATLCGIAGYHFDKESNSYVKPTRGEKDIITKSSHVFEVKLSTKRTHSGALGKAERRERIILVNDTAIYLTNYRGVNLDKQGKVTPNVKDGTILTPRELFALLSR
jgi:hypothetical protein